MTLPDSTVCGCKDRPRSEITWSQYDDEMQQGVEFVVGYNCEASGPKSHGVHGMEIRWYLRGPKGCSQFAISTYWTPGELRPGHGLSPNGQGTWRQYPNGIDVGYHAHVPQYPDQWGQDECSLLGGPCFYDGSGLQADDLVKRFVAEGEPAIWSELLEVYNRIEDRDV